MSDQRAVAVDFKFSIAFRCQVLCHGVQWPTLLDDSIGLSDELVADGWCHVISAADSLAEVCKAIIERRQESPFSLEVNSALVGNLIHPT